MKQQLVIIPGLGDRGRLYRLIKPLWALFGFDVHIFVFGWESETSFATAFQRLLDYIDSLPGQLCIIGVSAGGTAAINALAARPTVVAKVATVCTPYKRVPHLPNKLLAQSIEEMKQSLQSLGDAKQKALSVHGAFDPVVPTALSRPKGIPTIQMRSRGHGLSIIMALTIMSKPLRQFLDG